MFGDAFDVFMLALVAWREARNGGVTSMQCVMEVLISRAKAHNTTIFAQAVMPNQFSSLTSKNDPELGVWPQPAASADWNMWEAAKLLAPQVLNGSLPLLTAGALYYDNPKTATSAWFKTAIINDPTHHPKVATVGGQDYYL
jgi:hypothetical protein